MESPDIRNPIRDRFAARLRGVRGQMTQAEFAQLLGISRSGYSHYESGRLEPNLQLLWSIGERTGVSIDYLLGLSENPARDMDPEKTWQQQLESLLLALGISESDRTLIARYIEEVAQRRL